MFVKLEFETLMLCVKLKPNFLPYLAHCLLVSGLLFFTSSCQWVNNGTGGGNSNSAPEQTNSLPAPESAHLLLGNPSNAVSDPNNRDNYLLLKSTFAISYNNSRGTANWVAWKTTISDLGDSIERPEFRPDQSLPKRFVRVNATDYTRSGYQRGHLVPSADRFSDAAANLETLMMTNIVPQTGDLNQFPWAKFESYVRFNVRRNSDVYQIAGVYGDKERIRKKVTAPTNCWKIVLILPAGSDVANIDRETRIIAIDMPNSIGIAKDRWQKHKTTVRSIEQKTGYNFLSRLPGELQEVLENRIDGR